MLRLRGSGSHSAPVPVPASAAIAQQPHSPWIGAERKEFYSSWHNVDKEKGKMMMMMILKIKIPGTPSPPRANDPRQLIISSSRALLQGAAFSRKSFLQD